MLAELSDHIMDIAMNSVRAGARNVSVTITAPQTNGSLSILIEDDGVGMEQEVLQRVSDPFFSTKEGKSVGLGVSLLKGATEVCEGSFTMTSERGKGTGVKAVFPVDHPDVPPLGNLKDTVLLLCVTNPGVRFFFRIRLGGRLFELDTGQVKDILQGLPISHPEVVKFLEEYIGEHL